MRRPTLLVAGLTLLSACTGPTVKHATPRLTRPPSDSLDSANMMLWDRGGEITLVRGLTPTQVLAVMAPGRHPRPARELCDENGDARSNRGRHSGLASDYKTCLTAQAVGQWTLVFGLNDLTVAKGGDRLLEHLSADGREVVWVADHFEADAPFSVARNGRVIRTFDFCSEGHADEGAPLPEEQGLDVTSCDTNRLVIAQRLTGVKVTEDLLLRGDRIALEMSL